MKKHELNIPLSREIATKYNKVLRVRECYQNIARCADAYLPSFTTGKWKIAYGYYTASPKIPHLLARHCFILDENDCVVDPTIMLRHEDSELSGYEYFVMKSFDDYKDYLRAIIRDRYYDMTKTLLPYDRRATIWANQNGYLLLD